LQEYDPVVRKLIGSSRKIFDGSSIGITEGPHLIRRDDWYYLLTAEGGTVWEHAATIARSRSLFGPYELSPHHPLLSSNESPEAPLQKAGHASLVEGPDGGWWLFHLCGRPVDGVRGRCMLGRETSVQAVDWPSGGWPRLRQGEPTPAATVELPLAGEKAPPYRAVFRDDFEGGQLHSEWNTLREAPTEDWLSLTARSGYLRLQGRNSLRARHAVSLAALRVTAMACTARVRVSFQPKDWRQRSGLVLYYDDAHHIALEIGGTEAGGRVARIYHCDQGRQLWLSESALDMPISEEIELEAQLQFGCLTFRCRPLGGSWQPVGDPLDATIISDDRVWESVNFGFTGAYFGLYACDSGDSGVPTDFTAFEVIAQSDSEAESRETSAAKKLPLSRARRIEWCHWAARLAEPVLSRLAEGRLRAEMPIEAQTPEERKPFTQLEVVARLLAGIGPWLELPPEDSAEGAMRARYRSLAQKGLAHAADPESPEAFNFTEGKQTLVDAAFLAQAFLRAPHALWRPLDAATRERLIQGFEATRAIVPYENNWWLFAAMIEAFLQNEGLSVDADRLTTALEKHETWYKGDGAWGDGPDFHWDYYNAYVIQPMLVDLLAVFGKEPRWAQYQAAVEKRVARYVAVQERFIASDGSFPVLGRSVVYRAGAFQVLAQAALRERLPDAVPPGQARVALTRLQRKTLNAAHTFDAEGWLRIGLAGHQPALAENYISSSSLYLCSTALLPLGLPADAAFWTDRDRPLTSDLAWKGTNLPADQALQHGE
jgi:hypothetical protein